MDQERSKSNGVMPDRRFFRGRVGNDGWRQRNIMQREEQEQLWRQGTKDGYNKSRIDLHISLVDRIKERETQA